MRIALSVAIMTVAAGWAVAEPVKYTIDPTHTYPSFQADHMGGLSNWRGKFNKSSGTILLDKVKQEGSVEVTVDTASVDFGMAKMNEHARSAEIFDVAKYPTATYKGKLAAFEDGKPTEVQGEFTLHGVTHPLNLKIHQFLCKQHPMTKKEVCGADASGEFDRADYGVDFGVKYGFKMLVKLQIQVEASP